MKRILKLLLLFILPLNILGQQGQLSVSRIDQMPDLPSPLDLRDWSSIAMAYDSFIYDFNKTGDYLPLGRLGSKGQFNYPDNIPVFLDSYVGADAHLNQAEAINIIPSIVGASLVGIDKSNQDGVNWVAKIIDFYNSDINQQVYLNNYGAASGNDWWYDIMPNVYFYQLRALYPNAAPEFDSQFLSVANQWLYAVKQLGGSTTPWTIPDMNYRAFDLATGMPLTTGVPEPESAGSIAWLLYNAYTKTGNRMFFEGAQLAMDFLAGFETNPSYELQLPYGTLAAVRMNAIEGTAYPVQKLLDWCFNRGDLRGWGAIVGTWGEYDVSGLIGEANDNGNDYAFVMNGFQQAAALAPLPKYDKRYAHAVAKWLLNLTNASRLFYPDALHPINQDSYEWASQYNPQASIPYESMKETWGGKEPFATGDAIRGGWAETNLSLYSGSSVGYLAAVVSSTTVPEIIQIDLNKTDFYGDQSLVSYLYYNPTPTTKQIELQIPEGSFGVYDAITESILFSTVSGSALLAIPAGEVRLIRFYPADLVPQAEEGRLYAGELVLDYNYGYVYPENLRVKALSVSQNPVVTSSDFVAYCEPGNISPTDQVQVEWFINSEPVEGQDLLSASLTAPLLPGELIVKCIITINGQTAEDTLHVEVVDRITSPPVIKAIETQNKFTATGGVNIFTVEVEPVPGDTLDYFWYTSAGEINGSGNSDMIWEAPEEPGVYRITIEVTNKDFLTTTANLDVLVKDTTLNIQPPLIYYPFDFDNKNAMSDAFHAVVSGPAKTADARQMPMLAYRFSSGNDIIYTDNHPDLNFTGVVGLSCWVKPEQYGTERFIVSHGSWQQRYKLSITPEGILRWTVKTDEGVMDLDGSQPVDPDTYYHVTAQYTGYSMELYVNGILDSFKKFTGNILPSTKALTIGRMDKVETQYALVGSVDEVKIWNRELSVKQIEQLPDQWATPLIINDTQVSMFIYPNPAHEYLMIKLKASDRIERIYLVTLQGYEAAGYHLEFSPDLITVHAPNLLPGLYVLRLILSDGRGISKKVIFK